jgi:hypothetical protein
MATVVLHAGMPKAGSSAIQQFLHRNATAIEADTGTRLLVFRRAQDGDPGGLQPYTRGSINSGAVWFRFLISNRDPAVFETFFRDLDRAARGHERVLLTSEAFASPIAELEPSFLAGLARLGETHEVHVAYYVRAQHESLEAGWRQWGFRSDSTPGEYLRRRERTLDYDATREGFADQVPGCSFDMRPYVRHPDRPSALIDDFAAHYLPGLSDMVTMPAAAVNPGLPLDVINVLRYAPRGLFWESQDDNASLRAMKELFAGAELVDSTPVVASRERLHRMCHERFEAGNRRVARTMGWTQEGLIAPPPTTGLVDDDYDFLDELWDSRLDARAREQLFTALRRALDGDHAAHQHVLAAFSAQR